MPRKWPPVIGRIRGRVIGRRYRVPAGLCKRNQGNLLSVLVKDPLSGSLPGTRAGHPAFGAGGRLTQQAKEMSRDHNDARHAAPTSRATAAGRRQLAGRSGPVECLVCRIGRRPAGARAPAPDRRGADYRADRGFDGAAGRQGGRGQYRVTGAWTGCWPGPASWTPGPTRRSASGPSCWPGSRPDGGLPAACRSRTPSMNWPATSICTLAARGRTAPRASLSPAAGSSTTGG